MKSNWDTFKGKRIFVAHYDHLTADELQAEVSAVEKEILQQPSGSVLFVGDVSGTVISPDALNLFKNAALHTRSKMRKCAVLGVTGARRMLLEIVVKFSGMEFLAFENVQQANEWLIK